MVIIIQPIIWIVICITVGFISKNSINKTNKNDVRKLKLSPVLLYVGCISSIVLCGVAFFLYFYGTIEASFVCATFSCFALVLVFGYYGYDATYDRKKVVYRKFFGKYKTIYYCNIVDIEFGMDLIIRTKRDTLIIRNYVVNVAEFHRYLSDIVAIDRDFKDTIAPRVRKFKDSVYRPKEFVFAFSLFIAVATAAEVMFLWAYITGQVKTTEDLKILLGVGVFVAIFFPLYVFLAVFSAKRAHSSKKWRKVACLLVKESYLKD